MQSSKPSPVRSRSVAVMLFPEFSNLCLANAVEPLRAANAIAKRSHYRWRFVGTEKGVIASSSGLPVQLLTELSEDPGGDILLIMPSYGHKGFASPPLLRAISAARRRFGLVVGLDAGAWLLAAAGLLNRRRATIHWDLLADFAETFPEVEVLENRVVFDGDVASCGGATTTLELLLALVERHHGPMLSLEVAALLMHGERDPRPDPALRLPDDRVVRAAAALMRRNLERPLTIREVASALNLSQRALEQRFRQAIGAPPSSVYRSIRVHEARRLAEQTRHSVAEIASRCGYADAAAMTRAFKAVFGRPPSALRREARLATSW